jgi:hypothetical protein
MAISLKLRKLRNLVSSSNEKIATMTSRITGVNDRETRDSNRCRADSAPITGSS